MEFGREGFEHLCGVLAICIWCIGLSSLWRIWFELLIGACPSWVLGTLDGFVALVALWPFVAFVGSLQLSCGEVPQPCERFRFATDKCTDSGSVDRSRWGEIHRRIREAFCGVGGLIPPPLQTRRTPCWEELGKISVSPRASVISIPELFTYALYIVIASVLEVLYILLSLCCLYCLA